MFIKCIFVILLNVVFITLFRRLDFLEYSTWTEFNQAWVWYLNGVLAGGILQGNWSYDEAR